MARMSVPHTTEILDAIEHLPGGATLVVPQFSWEDYERLLLDLADRPGLRISYDCGTLEIMSPSPKHERYVRLFDRLVHEFGRVRSLTVEMFGEATWKKRALAKGLQPDCCYYIGNAERIIGNENPNLEFDPPPDIAVEIDLSGTSLRKLSIYAALTVPEIWRYNGTTVQIYELSGAQYLRTANSRFLPGLTGTLLSESIDWSKTQGQTKAIEKFGRRIRKLK
jgi:Uma2 family endonuclease